MIFTSSQPVVCDASSLQEGGSLPGLPHERIPCGSGKFGSARSHGQQVVLRRSCAHVDKGFVVKTSITRNLFPSSYSTKKQEAALGGLESMRACVAAVSRHGGGATADGELQKE